MPLGLMIGSPMPRLGDTQSRFELTVLYRRTSASVCGTPTLNCTVSTAMPGRDTEYTCSMPLICASTCSAGVATSVSTSRAEAPGNGTSTFAMVTLICGSSSRGVTATAKTPSRNATSASSGVSCDAWKKRAMRPEAPMLRPRARPFPP